MEPLTLAVAAIIPCLEEEAAIGPVVSAIRAQGVATVIVVDGGSRDRTAQRAQEAGAIVLAESRRGYGRAVQAGIRAVPPGVGIVLFLDGDGSDPPERIPDVLAPILTGRAIFVHGTRMRGEREAGSLSPQQVAAARMAGLLLRLFYGARFTDMSPFRAIRREALEGLGMREETYGWNLEMLMRVAAARLPAEEVAVGQRRRQGGVSKVSGNPRAVAAASWSIATTFLRLAMALRRG
ncbi:MAG TPA: glycosyltransferase family 2 protein [Falsiroseomonas sp.]|jgi:glycosyltransferase involved in cell wall biosynthesis|nr:glycosyltransferase family 2 protein [Falsiroseomonas sp.]